MTNLEIIFAHDLKEAVDVLGSHFEIVIGHHDIFVFFKQTWDLLEGVIEAIKLAAFIKNMRDVMTLPFFGGFAIAGDDEIPIALAFEPAFVERVVSSAHDDEVFGHEISGHEVFFISHLILAAAFER